MPHRALLLIAIALEGGRHVKNVNRVVLLPDVTRYQRLGATQWETVDTQEILRIDRTGFERDASRTIRAGVIGAVPGLLLTLLSLADGEDNPSLGGPTREALVLGSLGLALIGGSAGALIGGSVQQVESTPYRAPMSDYFAPADSSSSRSERR